MIDVSKIISASEQAATDLARWRHETNLTRWQLKATLHTEGYLAGVDAVIAGMDDFTRLQWAESTLFPRDNPLIDQIGAQIGLTPEQIDTLYAQALLL